MHANLHARNWNAKDDLNHSATLKNRRPAVRCQRGLTYRLAFVKWTTQDIEVPKPTVRCKKREGRLRAENDDAESR